MACVGLYDEVTVPADLIEFVEVPHKHQPGSFLNNPDWKASSQYCRFCF